MKEKDLKNSYSKVCGVAYDINDIKRIIAFCRKHNFKWYYIRHNDYDENMEEKKKHYHFIIESDSSHRFNIKSLLTDTFKCNLINKLDNVAYYLRYMIHIDYIDKQHYDIKRIISNVSNKEIEYIIKGALLTQKDINNANFVRIINMVLNGELTTFKEIMYFCIDNDIRYCTPWSFTLINLLKEGIK